jgi:hypothetical protein
MANQYPRVPDVKGRYFVDSMIVGEGGQLYDFGAWLKVRTQCFQSCPKNFHSKTPLMTCRKHELLKTSYSLPSRIDIEN